MMMLGLQVEQSNSSRLAGAGCPRSRALRDLGGPMSDFSRKSQIPKYSRR